MTPTGPVASQAFRIERILPREPVLPEDGPIGVWRHETMTWAEFKRRYPKGLGE